MTLYPVLSKQNMGYLSCSLDAKTYMTMVLLHRCIGLHIQGEPGNEAN